jgi:3-dehydroquinate synthetase
LCAAEISKNLEIFSQNELKLLNDVVKLTGTLPATDKIEIERLQEAFEFDKKASGKNLQWILLEKIGSPVIIEGERISRKILQKSLRKVLIK